MIFVKRGNIFEYISTAADPRNPSAQEQADALAAIAAEEQAAADAEAARLAKRPKRSEIEALKASVSASSSIAALKASNLTLIAMLENVLDLQRVPVVEDI